MSTEKPEETGEEPGTTKNHLLQAVSLGLGAGAGILAVLQLNGSLPAARQTHFVTLFLAGSALALWVESLSKKKPKR